MGIFEETFPYHDIWNQQLSIASQVLHTFLQWRNWSWRNCCTNFSEILNNISIHNSRSNAGKEFEIFNKGYCWAELDTRNFWFWSAYSFVSTSGPKLILGIAKSSEQWSLETLNLVVMVRSSQNNFWCSIYNLEFSM